MLSDDVLDLYIYGKYKKSQGHTYVLPPKIKYFQRLMLENSLYKQIYNILLEGKEVYATNSENYWKNIQLMQPKIKEALKEFSDSQKSKSRVKE